MSQETNRFLFDKRDFIAERTSVLHMLEQAPGKQLVLVQYGPEHDCLGSCHGPQKNLELLSYYHDRRIWRLIDYDKGRVELSAPDRRK